MASDELRPRPVPRPAPTRGEIPASQLPGEGRLPLATGKVHMSDYTQRQLMAAGWKPGDPVPGDLGQRLKEIQQKIQEEQETARLEDSDLAVGWKPVNPSFVDIENMPEAYQNEVREYLQEYKQQVADEKAMAEQEAAADRSIPDNIQGQQREVMRQQMIAGDAAMAARQAKRAAQRDETESVVIDDRKPGLSGVAAQVEAAKATQAKYEAEQKAQPAPPPVEQPATGVASTHTNCQRCAWPLDVPFEIVPTDKDKQGFMAGILGLGRFEKHYELLGGNLEVYFRSLSTAESTMIQKQLGAMVRSGEVIGDGEFWACLMEFRMVLSVSRLVIGGNVKYEAKPIIEWEKDFPPVDKILPTPIPRLADYFYEHCASQEPLRRILGQTHQEFQRLVEALEVMTNKSDFWKGIELPA